MSLNAIGLFGGKVKGLIIFLLIQFGIVSFVMAESAISDCHWTFLVSKYPEKHVNKCKLKFNYGGYQLKINSFENEISKLKAVWEDGSPCEGEVRQGDICHIRFEVNRKFIGYTRYNDERVVWASWRRGSFENYEHRLPLNIEVWPELTNILSFNKRIIDLGYVKKGAEAYFDLEMTNLTDTRLKHINFSQLHNEPVFRFDRPSIDYLSRGQIAVNRLYLSTKYPGCFQTKFRVVATVRGTENDKYHYGDNYIDVKGCVSD